MEIDGNCINKVRIPCCTCSFFVKPGGLFMVVSRFLMGFLGDFVANMPEKIVGAGFRTIFAEESGESYHICTVTGERRDSFHHLVARTTGDLIFKAGHPHLDHAPTQRPESIWDLFQGVYGSKTIFTVGLPSLDDALDNNPEQQIMSQQKVANFLHHGCRIHIILIHSSSKSGCPPGK